jgi:hypothetical protein
MNQPPKSGRLAQEGLSRPVKNASRGETDLAKTWQALITKLRTIKLPLASRLELASPSGLENETLYIQFPSKHALNRDHFEENKALAETILSELIGRTAKIVSDLKSGAESPKNTENSQRKNEGLEKIGNVFEYEEVD